MKTASLPAALNVTGVAAAMALLYVFLRFTKVGLAMRASAENPVSSRLAGIPVSLMLSLGWGLSALIGAVHHAIGDSTHHDRVTVQPVSIAYVCYGGVPVGRALRDKVAWYGETELVPHLMNVLSSGAVDVTVSWGDAVGYGMNADRKQIARDAEAAVRRMTARALRSPAAQPSGTEGTAPSAVPAFDQT